MLEFIRFLFGGFFNTLVSATSYYAFSLFFDEYLALGFSFWLTFIVSYAVNSKFVFRVADVKLLFFLAVILAFFMQQFIGAITVWFGGSGMFVFFVVSLVHVPFFYILCRFWVFRERKY
ncbi:hypothetical protein [Marinomonas primoryensis]|uniref:Putative transmembrane protein n=1 Tax=Marinomonas primoryensis TaxID=178399 RepID=A0A859CZ41_9GAMM|nr:hypothetical protein [Marinomonas primoryensis]QKK81956.1 putative transmembrane protein [Marinomonas primoryensis]